MLMLQPLTPSDAKPDMAMLRLIKESELLRGQIIGSGAFGTVYKVSGLFLTHSRRSRNLHCGFNLVVHATASIGAALLSRNNINCFMSLFSGTPWKDWIGTRTDRAH